MSRVHVVVDGSNIATEGRTAPSLAQLDEAVRAFVEQHGHQTVTVVVDATFGHRIDASERPAFEEAILEGELVTPPAGTIGRGDVFILEVARRADADVLSNDSFQELHAEHPWLFEPGRLWGGKPVPAVGWVFVARAPVRGVTSRRAVQAAKRAKREADAAPVPTVPPPAPPAAPVAKRARRGSKAAAPALVAEAPVEAAPIDAAAADAGSGGRRRRRRGSGGGDAKREPINEQLVYAAFVIEHPVGSVVEGAVDRFSSHGAYIALDGGASGYVALRSLGDPPPRSAREVLDLGERQSFRVARFDPTTRGIDVVPLGVDATQTSVAGVAGTGAAPADAGAVSSEPDAEEAPVSPAAKKTAAKKKAAAKKAPAKKAAVKKAVAKKAPAKKAVAKKAVAKKAPAKKAVAKKAAAKKAVAKKAAAKKAPAKKAAAKKATAKKATAKKAAKR